MKHRDDDELTQAEEDEVYIEHLTNYGFCEDTRPKRWIIEGIVPEGVTVLFGASGAGKSFVALDMAYTVATGRPWLGKYEARQQNVLYVSAEDTSNHRHHAAAIRYGYPQNLFLKLGPIRLLEPKVVRRFHQSLANMEKGTQPGLIIIDTVASCMAGAAENDSGPMSQFANTINDIASSFNASVLLVHHNGKDEGGMRGHTALRSSVASTMKLTRPSRRVNEDNLVVPLTLTIDKAPRNGRPFGKLHLEQVEVPLVEAGGEEEACILDAENRDRARYGLPALAILPPITSCVIREAMGSEDAAQDEEQPRVEARKERDEPVLVALTAFGSDGASYGKWEAVAGIKGGTFSRTKDRLIASGRVRKSGNLYVAVPPFATPLAA